MQKREIGGNNQLDMLEQNMALIQKVETNLESLQNAHDTLAELLGNFDEGVQSLNHHVEASEAAVKGNPADASQKTTKYPQQAESNWQPGQMERGRSPSGLCSQSLPKSKSPILTPPGRQFRVMSWR